NARVLDWARREVATSADPRTRQRLLSLFSTTRNLVVDEAFRRPNADNRAMLVTAMERWKGVGLREDQLLARLAGEGDPKTVALARELSERSAATDARGATATRVAELRTQLSETSSAYAQARRRAEVTASEIAAALRPGELFLDIWVVPASMRGGKDEDRVVGALIGPDGVRAIRGLGDVGSLTPFLRIENIFAVGRIAEAAYGDYIPTFAADIARASRPTITAVGPWHTHSIQDQR